MLSVENDACEERIDYVAAVSGGLLLICFGTTHAIPVDGYARILVGDMLIDESEPLDRLVDR